MGEYADYEIERGLELGWNPFGGKHRHAAYRPMHLAKKDITCNRCGTPAYWQETIDKDGHPKIKLFSGGKPHVCPPPADDFTDVTGADLG